MHDRLSESTNRVQQLTTRLADALCSHLTSFVVLTNCDQSHWPGQNSTPDLLSWQLCGDVALTSFDHTCLHRIEYERNAF